MILCGRSISNGVAEAPILSSSAPISFLGQVDAKTGVVIDAAHPLYGMSVAGRVLAFPYGKGSTVGSYVIYALMMNGVAPAAFVVRQCETIVAVGAIISGIPAVDRVLGTLPEDGAIVLVDGTKGVVSFS